VAAFGLCHLLLLLGVIGFAAALKEVVAHPLDGLQTEQAITLGVAVGLFMLGDVLFRRSLDIAPGPARTVVAVVAVATIPLGLAGAALQLAALVALLAAALVSERRAARVSVP
jgi:low temperature requirement protein LtrA